MKYCTKCLTTDLRPNSMFIDGVCIACEYASSQNANSSSRIKLRTLEEKIRLARQKIVKKGPYDCIVGVSGGKDSSRQAHWVRDRLGLRPLLVCCGYPPKQMSQIGADNLSNLMGMGFDLIVATPAPKTAAHLSLESFKQFGNVCKASEMSLFSTVPRLAIDFGVNVIFWGENPALQVGDSATAGQDEFDGNNLRNLSTLVSGGDDWLTEAVPHRYKFMHYRYPEELEFSRKKINIFYLGAAWDDWSVENNSTYAALQGLELRPGEQDETGDISNASMLDEEFTNINMMLKYYKFGFGRATDAINEMIRAGKITRETGVEVVERYDGVCSDRIIESYCRYVGISISEFWRIANQWVNKDLFEIKNNQRPKRNFIVGENFVG